MHSDHLEKLSPMVCYTHRSEPEFVVKSEPELL